MYRQILEAEAKTCNIIIKTRKGSFTNQDKKRHPINQMTYILEHTYKSLKYEQHLQYIYIFF